MRRNTPHVAAIFVCICVSIAPKDVVADGREDTLARECMQQAKENVNRAIRRTEIRYTKDDIWSSPMDLLQFFKRPPTEETMIMARAGDIFETAVSTFHKKLNHRRFKRRVNVTDVLSSDTLQELSKFAGCRGSRKPQTCSNSCHDRKYRTISGECNNLQNQYWGSANNKLRRWLPSQYENDFTEPMGWNSEQLRNGFRLPMVRKLSNEIIHTSNDNITDDDLYSHMIVVWGQYIDHDFDFTPQSLSTSTFQGLTNCKETCANSPPCFPIMIPGDDPRITTADCMPFFRSAAVCGTGETAAFFDSVAPREQINAVTSYVDASTVYGSTDSLAMVLRNTETDEGLMKVNDRFDDEGREYLPFNPANPCVQDPSDASGEQIPCFHAGDGRVSEHSTLSGIHTLWVREHNRLARALKELNPHWNGEVLYQEARKIVGSLHQVVHYREYVPKIIGTRGLEILGEYNGYDPQTDPTISNVFATAAFRFGHVTIAPMFRRLGEDYEEHPQFRNILLHRAFFSPWRIIKEGGLDPIFRGLIGKPAKLVTPTQIMHEELREKLFQLQNQIALDLASLNLQRSRDHALPLYNDWREFCNLSRVSNFSEVASEIGDAQVRRKLEELYGHPGNIDLWLAGLVEDLVNDSRVGPTFMCLLAKQFKYQRDGDRFFYMNDGVHTEQQRDALNNVRLANVLCANTGLTRVQSDAFRMASFPDEFEDCDDLPPLDLEPWRESPEVGSCGRPEDIENGFWSICEDSVIYYCNSGFRLVGSNEVTCASGSFSADPPTCEDNNECDSNDDNDCEDMCMNTEGSYSCGCNEGRQLGSDGKSCMDLEIEEINAVAIAVGAVLGVAVFAALVGLAIMAFKYISLKESMPPNSRYPIDNSFGSGSISSGVDNPMAVAEKM